MARYVTLFTWTDQGIRQAQDTTRRVEQAQAAWQPLGARIETIFWTQGHYDLVGIVEAPDDETLAAALLLLAKSGNVRTETLRAFTAEEMQHIFGKVG